MAKKIKTTDPETRTEVKKGVFGRTKTLTVKGDDSNYSYKQETRNKKGDVIKTKEGLYSELPTETIDKGYTTNRKGKTRYYDRSTSNVNSREQRMTFPGMKKGGSITALDQVDKFYKAKYKKK